MFRSHVVFLAGFLADFLGRRVFGSAKGVKAAVPGATSTAKLGHRPPATTRGIQDAEGKKVALRYNEKRGIPSSCFGDTHYFISAVRTLAP
jgi:hypothetical protein